MTTRTPALLICLFLTGCQDLFDRVDGLTNPLTGLGFVVGTEAPDDTSVDLSGAGIEVGTALTVFLADAAEVASIEDAPIDGADVSLHGTEARGQGEGVYALSPTDGPAYVAGETWSLDVVLGDYVASAALTLPQRPVWTAPGSHAAGADLVVDLSGQGYDSVQIVVIDAESGAVTWTNEPEGIRELYDMTHGTAETAITIPGAEAFPAAGVYAIGVAGMQHTRAADLEEFNTLLSTLMAGKMRTFAVTAL